MICTEGQGSKTTLASSLKAAITSALAYNLNNPGDGEANLMRIMLFGGGLAGHLAASRLASQCAEHLAGIVWDESTGDRPPLPAVPFFHADDCRGVADTGFCSGYGGILGEELLRAFPGGCYNAHPSLLPKYRGRHAIQWAIASGERELGVSIHTMTPAIDRG